VPLYTYECPAHHTWEEVRGINESSEVSESPCEACMEAAGGPWVAGDKPAPFGRKVPSQVSRPVLGRGATPTFYPNQEHK
jgi:hypothetical protein